MTMTSPMPTHLSKPHTLARADLQLPLLSIAPRYRITKNGQARNAYGTVAQEIVCAVLRLDPIRINGNCTICFDAERDGVFYEIKSVKRNGKVVLYDWRMEKEHASRVPLRYAILVHGVTRSNGYDLFAEMVTSGLKLLIIDACTIHTLALTFPLCTPRRTYLDPHNGYTRHGYKDGYRNVPVREIEKRLPDTEKQSRLLYNTRFSITLHTAL
jgi:hypothetical protein